MNVNEKLSSKNVAELRKLAAGYGIAGRSTMKKADLIGKLIDAGVETRLAIDEITPEQEAAYAAKYSVAQAKTDDEAEYIEDGLKADADAGAYSSVNEVAILRDAPGRAIVTAAFNGTTVGGSIVRKGKRLVLTAGKVTVSATSFEKIAKRFAQRLGFRADVIDVQQSF